ncbi:hypothetical protein Bpfe_015767, partial [Biomphalaria pfeifferi]
MKSTNGKFLKPYQSTICSDTEKTIEDTAQESFLRENNSMVNKDGQRSSYLLVSTFLYVFACWFDGISVHV